MNKAALEKLGYGIYLIVSKDEEKDNGCITNCVMQVTSGEVKIVAVLNKRNLTHDMILKNKKFNVCILTEETSFAFIQRFGFLSGRECDKFKDYPHAERAKNGILYVMDSANSYLSAEVLEAVDVGSHTLFIAEVTQANVFSNAPSATYAYYHSHIKAKSTVIPEKKGDTDCHKKSDGYYNE